MLHTIQATVGYLGPEGTFSYAVARAYAEKYGYGLQPYPEIEDVLDARGAGEVGHAVVPIANSSGVILEVLEWLLKNGGTGLGNIVEEALLPIKLHLLGRPGTLLKDVAAVYCHMQPRRQCRRFIRDQQWSGILHDSTSTAASAVSALASTVPAVAIASPSAAKNGLVVLSGCINDNPFSATRFIILNGKTTAPTGNDKTTIFFELPNPKEAGALCDALAVFKQFGISFTKIDSETSKDQFGRLVIWVDAVGHKDDSRLSKCLTALADPKVALHIRVVGSYPAAPDPYANDRRPN